MQPKSNHISAVIAYITFIPGLIFLLLEKEDMILRVNAAQSVILSAAFALISSLPFFLRSLTWCAGIAYVIIVVICMVKASNGDVQQIPYVTKLAEKMADIKM